MSGTVNLSRRRFLKTAGVAAGGLVVATHLPWDKVFAAENGSEAAVLEPNALIAVGRDGRVTMQFTWCELGQGAMTSLAMVVADELCVDPDAVDVETPVWEPKFGYNVTGGSQSMRNSWVPLRQAAAAARVMLIGAAAEAMGAPAAECVAVDGHVVHEPSGRRMHYGELAEPASHRAVPDDPPLRERADHVVIGTCRPRRDTPAKVRGEAVFGFDLDRPGLLRAASLRAPVMGGRVASVDDAAARAVPGVRDVVRLDDRVSVLADDAWSAFRGREALRVEWDHGEHGNADSASIRSAYERRADEPAHEMRHDGDVDAALAAAHTVIRAEYRTPFIAHAAMEPSSCVAHVHDGRCEVEAPTQGAFIVAQTVAGALGMRDVRVQPTLVGSAFGRRLVADYAAEAALLSREAGAPVQVIWTREDETRHDYYRPATLHRLAGGLDADGRVIALDHTVVAPSISGQRYPGEGEGPDEGAVRGAATTEYAVANLRASHAPLEVPVPLGYWRGVFDVQNAWAAECFVDELAAAAGRDPVELRLEMLPESSRLRRVVEEAARRSGWPHASAPDRTLGFACHACFASFGAQVAEVSLVDGAPKVHRIHSVIDCGPVVNPDAVRAQMEGGAAQALGVALRERITLEDGRVVQGNFDDYEPLRMHEMPEITTHLLDVSDTIGGVGEPVIPPTAPAVCNAMVRAGAERPRELPLA